MKTRLPLFLAAIGILLRIIPVWAMRTWYDENFSILLARLPIPRLLTATAGDVHPPLWYLLCWPLAHIPGIPAWMIVRLPSVLASIATLWVWWQLLRGVDFRPRVRLVAFGLFCLLPQQIYYAQEGRMYALLTLLVLSAWLCIVLREWVWLAVATALMLYLHNYGLFFAASLWLAALVYDRRTWRTLTLAMTAGGLAYIPWFIVLLRQMSEIHGSYWMIAVSLASVLSDLAHVYFVIINVPSEMLGIAVFYGVLTWVLISALRRRTLNLPAVILAILPVTLAAVVSATWQPVMLSRALIPSGAFIVLLLAEATEKMQPRPLLLLSIFCIPALAVNLAGTALKYLWVDTVVEKTLAMYEMIDDQWQEGDLLYYADGGVFVTGTVYFHNVDNALALEMCGPVRGGLTRATWDALGVISGPLPEHVDGRIWAVTAETPFNPGCEQDYLREHGLLDNSPLACGQDNELVRSCVYLVEP
jgi:hypothetical protein